VDGVSRKKFDRSSPIPYALVLDAATVFTGVFLMEAVNREFKFLFKKVLASEGNCSLAKESLTNSVKSNAFT